MRCIKIVEEENYYYDFKLFCRFPGFFGGKYYRNFIFVYFVVDVNIEVAQFV